MEKKDKTERRKHQRYKVNEDVFAVLGSGSDIMGRIQEMGEGGLSFTYRDSKRKVVPVQAVQPLSILSDGYDTAHNEPSKFSVKIVSDTTTEENTIFNSSTVKRMGIQFNDLTFYQKTWLVECMRKYTLDDDETNSSEKKG
jgi:PilZ domain